jgi:hypothetical protein
VPSSVRPLPRALGALTVALTLGVGGTGTALAAEAGTADAPVVTTPESPVDPEISENAETPEAPDATGGGEDPADEIVPDGSVVPDETGEPAADTNEPVVPGTAVPPTAAVTDPPATAAVDPAPAWADEEVFPDPALRACLWAWVHTMPGLEDMPETHLPIPSCARTRRSSTSPVSSTWAASAASPCAVSAPPT